VLLTPIHTNLGLVKNSGKAMSEKATVSSQMSVMPILNEELLWDQNLVENFEVNLNSTELAVWEFFRSLACDFLG